MLQAAELQNNSALPRSQLTINFLAMADFYHDDHQLVGLDLIDDSIIAHTDSIVALLRTELFGAGWEGIFPQAIYLPPQPLLDRPVERTKISLSTRGEPDGIGHERETLKPQVLLYPLPRNQAAWFFHDLARLV
jgi:hypothetical protein